MEHQFNPRSSSLPRHPAALPRPLNLNRGTQPSQPPITAAATITEIAPLQISQSNPIPSTSPSSDSSTPTNAHPLGPPTLLGIPSILRERIYTHLLSRRRIRGYPLVPYTTHTFPIALLLAGSERIREECQAFLAVQNTFNVVLNGCGLQPGYLFSPTATSSRPPPKGWIMRLCVHMHVDLNSLFVCPGHERIASRATIQDYGKGLIAGVKRLVTEMWLAGMAFLDTVELVIVEVIPEQLRIHPTCSVNEKHVRSRYKALVEPLLEKVGKGIVVRWRGLECVYVPEVVEHVGQVGEEEEEEEEESGGEEGVVEHDGGRGRRQGSEQARVLGREGGGWDRADDYEFLCTESLTELGKKERGRGFVNDSGEGMEEEQRYGAREWFGPMMRVDQLPTRDVGGEDMEEEEEEDEGGLPVPGKEKKRGLTRLVGQSRFALRLSTGEKDKEKMEKEREREAKERQREKEKLEKEREKQRAKAKKEQDKLEKKAEKRKSEGSKGTESQEQKESLKDKIKWFGPKKDGDDKEPRISTW